MKIVILGLSITSSWGNGHATTYRALVRELCCRGHQVLFLERDVPWYATNRDMPEPPYGKTRLYSSLDDLREFYETDVKDADAVIVGSYVPDGVKVGKWVIERAHGVRAFYDIDTPVTLAKLECGDYEYLTPDLIASYDLYLSFAGGQILTQLEQQYQSPCARALYCSVDPDLYYPQNADIRWDMGYLGTYSPDRQPSVKALLIGAAQVWQEGRFVVAGPNYPADVAWPSNVEHVEHIPPHAHAQFYNQQRWTLNITRADMKRVGYAPSVRLFEAAACGTPIISDYWEGLETLFTLDKDILISNSAEDTLNYLKHVPEVERRRIAENARQKVLQSHTAAHRARELEQHLSEVSAKIHNEHFANKLP